MERIKADYAAFLTATEEKARKIHDYAVKRREEDYAAACGAMEAAGDPQGYAAQRSCLSGSGNTPTVRSGRSGAVSGRSSCSRRQSAWPGRRRSAKPPPGPR